MDHEARVIACDDMTLRLASYRQLWPQVEITQPIKALHLQARSAAYCPAALNKPHKRLPWHPTLTTRLIILSAQLAKIS